MPEESGMIAATTIGEWLKLCKGWQISRVNIASVLCTTIPRVSGIPPSNSASAKIAARAASGRLDAAVGFKRAPLPI